MFASEQKQMVEHLQQTAKDLRKAAKSGDVKGIAILLEGKTTTFKPYRESDLSDVINLVADQADAEAVAIGNETAEPDPTNQN